MTFFWILAGLMAFACMALVLRPLWRVPPAEQASLLQLNRRVYRERMAELERDVAEGRLDAATQDELRIELERGLLTLDNLPITTSGGTTGRWPLLLMVVSAALAIMFYALFQYSPEIPRWRELQKRVAPVVKRILDGQPPTEAEQNANSLPDLIRGLQVALQKNPQQPEGWFMLGVAYAQFDMPAPALTAFERAWRQQPDEPRYALSYAQTRMFSSQGQLDEMSRRLLQSVLQKAPEHEGALLLLGLGAYRSGDFALAVPVLGQLQQVRAARLPQDDAEAMNEVRAALADARAKLQSPQMSVAASTLLRVKVTVDRQLVSRFRPDDVLFVYARALQGPPMPLAVVRRPAGELPLTVEMGDAHSLMPERLLSSVGEIAVGARISRNGSATAEAGDLEAVLVPVRQSGAVADVEVRINAVRP